jgi:hypothetical protein
MKTSVDLEPEILARARRVAEARGTTLDALIADGLRYVLGTQDMPATAYRLRKRSFGGDGLQPGLSHSDWNALRALAYGEPEE